MKHCDQHTVMECSIDAATESCDAVAYLGAALVPLASKGTSGHVDSRGTTFGSGLLDRFVRHNGRLEVMPMSAAQACQGETRYCAKLSNWRGGQVDLGFDQDMPIVG